MASIANDLSGSVAGLSSTHRTALEWFAAHAGQVLSWRDMAAHAPNDIARMIRNPKGIHKPESWKHALGVRQNLRSAYEDRDPVFREDGTWSYMYYQEGNDLSDPQGLFANAALFTNLADRVPVGVLRQTAAAPRSLYRVLGLALVVDWLGGYFRLEGLSPAGKLGTYRAEADTSFLELAARGMLVAEGAWDPHDIEDGRKRVMSTIVRRQGQPAFRQMLMDAYDCRCAVTKYDAAESLEAVHIVPYRGPQTNSPANGLLLRADLHTLFDYGLIAVDVSDMRLLVAGRLADTKYGALGGTPVHVPSESSLAPSEENLDFHRSWTGL